MEAEVTSPMIENFEKVLKDHKKEHPLGKRNAGEYKLLVVHMRQMADTLEEQINKKVGGSGQEA